MLITTRSTSASDSPCTGPRILCGGLGARPDFSTDPAWWREFELVAEQGLVWDLLLYDEQLPAAHELIRSFPETNVVLEAAKWPLDQSADGFRCWEERLQAVSEFPNVALKLQGLALLFGASVDQLRPWVATAVRIFGAGRCMFASHLPVDRLICSFDDLVNKPAGDPERPQCRGAISVLLRLRQPAVRTVVVVIARRLARDPGDADVASRAKL